MAHSKSNPGTPVQVECNDLECNYADNYYGDQVCVVKK